MQPVVLARTEQRAPRFRSLHRWIIPFILVALIPAPASARDLPDFTGLVHANKDVVVNISTTQTVANGSDELPDSNDPFNQFFRRYLGAPRNYRVRALGSGFIVSADGDILTNAHVVDDADTVVVRLSDRRELPARVIGIDKQYDIALLKIDAHDLPVAKLGDSSKLEVGQWVLAIGAPFGLSYSATAGIVSALARTLPSDSYVPFVQTDVPINPGNSGGPLFDLNGKVIGINSQIYSSTGGYMGLSFAIPINEAMTVAKEIGAKGYASHGWLGVSAQPLTEDLARSFGLKKAEGALVSQVTPKSPAQRAGLEPGDVIVGYNGKPITASEELPPLIGSTPVGETVPLRIVRHGEGRTLTVKIGELPAPRQHARAAPHKEGHLNIAVADLTPDQREQLDIGDRGVLVEGVGDGAAADAGIEPGDVILAVHGESIKNVDQLARLLNHLGRKQTVPVLVQRDGKTLFLPLTLTG